VGKFDGMRLTAVMAASAAVLNGCNRDDSGSWQASTATRTCVDQAGVRVADDRCDHGVGHGFGYYYFGAGRMVPRVGSSVGGGSSEPETGVSYDDAAHSFSVARGGFGGIGEGHGGGGEGGGAGE
jgi:hypothetical protein